MRSYSGDVGRVVGSCNAVAVGRFAGAGRRRGALSKGKEGGGAKHGKGGGVDLDAYRCN